MNNVLVFGIGEHFDKNKDDIYKNHNIIGFIDNFKSNRYIDGKNVLSPESIRELEFDEIIIASHMYWLSMVRQLLDISIPLHKIRLDYISKYLYYNDLKSEFEINHNKGVRIAVEKEHDIDLLKEVFDNEEYRIEGLDNIVVIDVGMNIGITSMFFALQDCVERVYSFEPFKDTYERALKNFSLNESTITGKIQTFCFGLGRCNEERIIKTVYLDYCDFNSTVAADVIPESSHDMAHDVKVQIRNAAYEINRIIMKNPDKRIICKIDTEGSEYEIFDVLNNDIIESIDIFFVEYHPVKGRNSITIKQLLLDSSFCVFSNNTSSMESADIGMIRAVNLKKACSKYQPGGRI